MESGRTRVLQFFVVLSALVIIVRLFFIQVIETKYKEGANNNVLRHEVQFPPRGEVYDRNGEFLVQSREAYDLLVVPRDVKPFDTLLMCSILEVDLDKFRTEFQKASRYSRRRPSVLFKQLSKETKLKLEERGFIGFYTQYRTVRSYPRKIAGNLLGYVGEVDERDLQRDEYYRSGDYIGKSGIELAYEQVLRGEKGVKIQMVDVHGMPKGSYADGLYDSLPTPGAAITCTIDAELQAFAEYLLEGKVGSIVAIEPATGEILVMASSPTYDPDELIGKERGNNYARLANNNRRPLYNRAVSSPYPPGSTFKLVNGLIALQEGTLVPSNAYPCAHGYTVGRGVKCHGHSSPVNLMGAIETSCNAYFCYAYRNLVDDPKYGGVKNGFDVWYDYVRSFGFGRKLDSDFINEGNGTVPTRETYDNKYRGSWNSLTTISLSIGQGELGVTPLQMTNFISTVANRGYYYIPHVVKAIEGEAGIDPRFYEKHHSKIDPQHFDPIIEGMYRAVHNGGTARGAYVEGLDICGKTGTAQNPQGTDHSTVACFAPRNDPKIAVTVYIEHGSWGATVAVPIARLIIEQYLNGELSRPELVEQIRSRPINYSSTYDR